MIVEGEILIIVFGELIDIGVIDYDCNVFDIINVEISFVNFELFEEIDLVYEWFLGVFFDGDVIIVGILVLGIYNLMVIDMIIGCVGENDLIVNDICEFFDIEFVDEFLLLICIVFIIVFDVFGFIF